jgi:hypothetical protein
MLKARQLRFPFILLAGMAAVGILGCLWFFLRTDNFSIYAFAQLFGVLTIVFIPLFAIAINFKIGQSIELTDDGVWSLVWVKPTRSRIWPKLERDLLKWTDLQKWKMRANLIYLYGPRRRVIINTALFKDGNEVIKFINKATKADG